MRPIAFAATAALTAVLLACGGSDPVPAPPADAPAAISGPQVFFLQVDT